MAQIREMPPISEKHLDTQKQLVASIIQRTAETLALLQEQPQRNLQLEEELVKIFTGVIIDQDIGARYGLGIDSQEWLSDYDGDFGNWESRSNMANFMKFSKGINGHPEYSGKWMIEVVSLPIGWTSHIPVEKVQSVSSHGSEFGRPRFTRASE